MNVEQQLKEAKAKGYNCSQSIVSIFASQLEMDEEVLVKLAAGFGGGVRHGEVCGALTGVVMLLGIKYGHDKNLIADKTREAIHMFETNHEFTRCKELLGYDLSIEEENKIILEQNLKMKICPALKAEGVNIAMKLLNE